MIIGLISVYLLLSWQVGLIRLSHTLWHTAISSLQHELEDLPTAHQHHGHGAHHHHPAYVEWILGQDAGDQSSPAIPIAKKEIDKHQSEKGTQVLTFESESQQPTQLRNESAHCQVWLSPISPPPRLS